MAMDATTGRVTHDFGASQIAETRVPPVSGGAKSVGVATNQRGGFERIGLGSDAARENNAPQTPTASAEPTYAPDRLEKLVSLPVVGTPIALSVFVWNYDAWGDKPKTTTELVAGKTMAALLIAIAAVPALVWGAVLAVRGK